MPIDEFEHLRERGLTQESVYRGGLVKVRVDTVALPDGEICNREIIEHPGAVAIVPLTADRQVIMVHQFRYAIERITLELPAGTCKPQEPAEATAKRELLEETGYEAVCWNYLGNFYVAPGYSTELIKLYLATGLTQATVPSGDRDEFLETVQFPLPETLAMIKDGRITDAKSIIGLWWVAFAADR
ncbi:MAG: NUDIX hydrolase [Cyanobacteria bacterium NC_groundwater_1444_Ag_S-0.65um_54_12]|nr:NUDIX hydrolase [Cyanobacteria bacterium NC_groundwater_1444_Ag_S-0.65um_54_12]